ncbi:MAG: hypothetical protein ABJL99_14665 [Aliishimia sp.]
MFALIYIVMSLAAVSALTLMILRIGSMMADCPDNGPAVRVGTVTVATGFAAIGTGGAVLIGAILPFLPHAPFMGLMLALGLAALCLGLGFTQAVATLRVVLMPPVQPQPDAA